MVALYCPQGLRVFDEIIVYLHKPWIGIGGEEITKRTHTYFDINESQTNQTMANNHLEQLKANAILEIVCSVATRRTITGCQICGEIFKFLPDSLHLQR